jgi:large subunit ribosomal protein L23
MHPYEVLRRPIITEKTDRQAEMGQYTFEVHPAANKLQVKEAVERAFDVEVLAVKTMVVPRKRRRYGRRVSHTAQWKKAIVTVAEGQRLEFFEGV